MRTNLQIDEDLFIDNGLERPGVDEAKVGPIGWSRDGKRSMVGHFSLALSFDQDRESRA